MLAGGGEACADIEHLRSQGVLFGAVPSDSTLYRTFRHIDPPDAGRPGGRNGRGPRPGVASRGEQLDENLAALDNLHFIDDEIAAIDAHAQDAGIDLWKTSRQAG